MDDNYNGSYNANGNNNNGNYIGNFNNGYVAPPPPPAPVKKPLSLIGTFVSVIISVFFLAIIYYVIFAVMEVTDAPCFDVGMIFSAVNSLILVCIIGLGGFLCREIGVGSYAPLTLVTLVYSAAQFGQLFLRIGNASVKGYVLYHMIVLFLYLLIALPILLMGFNNKRNK